MSVFLGEGIREVQRTKDKEQSTMDKVQSTKDKEQSTKYMILVFSVIPLILINP